MKILLLFLLLIILAVNISAQDQLSSGTDIAKSIIKAGDAGIIKGDSEKPGQKCIYEVVDRQIEKL